MNERLRSQDSDQLEKSPGEESKAVDEKESPKMELMARSHNQALIAFRLEQMVSGNQEFDATEINKALKELPPEIGKKFFEIAEEYWALEQGARADMEALVSSVENFRKEKQQNPPITPELLGGIVFMQRTGSLPEGRVEFFLREAYFILACEYSKDYARAYAGLDGNPNSRNSQLSGGTFYNRIKLVLGGREISTPVIMVRGKCGQVETKRIITHERQHFINHKLFGKFIETEKDNGNPNLRNIKDEVLAYIRDGSSGNWLVGSLNGELYENLFENLSADEKASVRDIFAKIEHFLNKNIEVLQSSESRAILVYQLAGISLEKFPKWLDAFEEYYCAREKMLEPFYALRIDEDIADDTFPWQKQTEPACARIYELAEKDKKIRGRAINLVYSLKNNSVVTKQKMANYLREHNELFDQVRKEAKKIRHNSAIMPHAGVSDLYEYRRLGLGEHKFVKKVQAEVLDAVKDFPQKEIDAISEYFVGKRSSAPKSLQRLEARIKTIVKTESGGQSCQVVFDRAYNYEDSFRASIIFEFSKDEQKKGISGTKFALYFHSTKFDLFYKR